jgi:spermidine/putrescine transport system substrate-binding protein
MEYNGDIAQVMIEDDDLNFVVPKEGAMKQSDTAGHPEGGAAPRERARVHQLHLDPKSGRKSQRPSSTRRPTRPPLR